MVVIAGQGYLQKTDVAEPGAICARLWSSSVGERCDVRNRAAVSSPLDERTARTRVALAAGAHEYVIKPFTADAIRDKLALLGLLPVGAAL